MIWLGMNSHFLLLDKYAKTFFETLLIRATLLVMPVCLSVYAATNCLLCYGSKELQVEFDGWCAKTIIKS